MKIRIKKRKIRMTKLKEKRSKLKPNRLPYRQKITMNLVD